LSELTQQLFGEVNESKYTQVQRACKQLADNGEIRRLRTTSEGLRYAANPEILKPKPEPKIEFKRWTTPVDTWWDKSCGSMPNVFDKLSPPEDIRTGKRGRPAKTKCAWSCVWVNSGLPSSPDLWYLAEADKSLPHLQAEGCDYVAMGLASDELVQAVLNPDDPHYQKRLPHLVNEVRPRRPHFTSPWNFMDGRRTASGFFIAPKF
jgi:hypothetical protein